MLNRDSYDEMLLQVIRSSSDAQIFNCSKLKEKIEDSTLGLSAPEPLGREGQICTTFLWGDDTSTLMLWLLKPCTKRQLTRKERTTISRITRGRKVVKNAFGILAGRFRVLRRTIKQRPNVVRDIVSSCVVLHNKLKTHRGRVVRSPIPTDDITAIINELAVYVPAKNP